MHADDLSSLPHKKTPLTSFYVFLSVNNEMATCYILPGVLHLCLFPFFSPLSHSCLPFFYFSCLCCFPLLLFSLTSFIFTSTCYLLLTSPPYPSFLPLFRLCKVQLGFGAIGLQAWRQEDALSEYALLGSLCVTRYFFAILIFVPIILFYRFLLLLYCSSHSHPVFLWVSLFVGGRPFSNIASVLQETAVSISGISNVYSFRYMLKIKSQI